MAGSIKGNMKEKNVKQKQQNKNPFKQALIWFGAFAAAAVALIAALVVYVDPFFHYHAPLKGFPYLVDNQQIGRASCRERV